MKILFSGYHNPHYETVTEYMERALRALGHEVIVYDDRRHIIPGRIRSRVGWLNRLDLASHQPPAGRDGPEPGRRCRRGDGR